MPNHDPNPPTGSQVTVNLEGEHIRLIYKRMAEAMPSAVLSGYDYMLDEGSFELGQILNALGEFLVTTTAPGTGGTLPPWSAWPEEKHPPEKPKKQPVETRLARALIKKPHLLRDISRKMQTANIPLLGPWRAGNGIRWERRYIYHPGKVAVWVEEASDGTTRYQMRKHPQADIGTVLPNTREWDSRSDWSSLSMKDMLDFLDDELVKKGWLLL